MRILVLLALILCCAPMIHAEDCPPGQEAWYTGNLWCGYIPDGMGGWVFDCSEEFDCVAPWEYRPVLPIQDIDLPTFTLYDPRRGRVTKGMVN